MLRPMSRTRKKLAIVAAIVVAVYSAGTVLRESLGISFDAASLREWVLGLGPLAPILFVFVVAGRAFLGLPSQLVLVAAGLCFGTLLGSLIGGVGLMLSGLLLFTAARYAGREAIDRRLGPRVRHILDFTSRRSGIAFFSFAFGYPISPLTPLHASAGFTPMPLANFAVAAFAGGVMRAAIYAYFGDALTESSLRALVVPTLIILVVLAVPLVFPSGREWLRNTFAPPRTEEAPIASESEPPQAA